MKEHEMLVKNKAGNELTVSKAYYEQNKDKLTPVKPVTTQKPTSKKMEKEPLKNKSM